jgi:type IV pilus assembly protein PilY1
MFILDDSGSMDWDYLPDDAPQLKQPITTGTNNLYGYFASQCNGVAYDPTITYKPPLNYDGSSFPQATYPKALSDGYNAKSSLTDLSLTPDVNVNANNFYYVYNSSGSQTKNNYVYSSSDKLDTSTTFYKECTSKIGNSPGSSVFTLVDVTTLNSTQRQNYANWYSYYHTRLLMMKTSVGLAFSDVDAKYRVGFTVINNQSTSPTVTHKSSGTHFLEPKEFSSVRDASTPTVPSQKEAFYSDLYITNASPSTPLRGALSLAGQFYAFKANGQKADPIQYSCQKNFTILSTDGYWNTGSESTKSPKYGPYQLDNITNVGQQDGAGTARPMFDGTSNTTTTVKTWDTTEVKTMITDTPVTRKTINTTKTESVTTNSSWVRNSYSALGSTTAFANSSITRCGNSSGTCTVTVTTAASNPYATGDSITIAGATPAAYNGTFTITRSNSTKFTYKLASQPSGNASPAGNSYKVGGCTNPGEGSLTTTPQTGAGTQTAVTTYLTTITEVGTSTSSVTTTTVTPYTETIININGINTSDTTVAGTASITNTTPLVTVTYGTPSNVNTTPVNAGTLSITWTNGTPSTACALAVPLPNPSTAAQVASTPAPMQTGPAASGTPSVVSGTAGTPYAGVPTSPATKGTVTTNTPSNVTSGGASDSLADVAMYYYTTDLRTSALGNCTGSLGTDVCTNNVSVSPAARDNAIYQHMTTFTLGLGNSGTLKFDTNYLSQSSGDYIDIVQGTKNWPTPGDGKNAVNIDDLWHAAVNGRGQFFSASDPKSLINSLRTTLQSIDAITGAASAAATSTLQPVQGDNDIYVAQYTSSDWYGDVLSYKIDPATGAIATTKIDASGNRVSAASWSAKDVLDATTPSTRTIYYPSSGALKTFNYDNIKADSLNSNFDSFCTKRGVRGSTATPTQCVTAVQADKDFANSGTNLVNYLRGEKTYANDNVYRKRISVLGDIIDASPLFVGQPSFKYSENNYVTFKATSRTAVVYAAANDGMLHAFDRTTGTEKWAYIPSFVLPNMYQLADVNYAGNHVFMVDGSPVAGDIYVNSAWKTILIGGLNSGGRGYYALDITNPESPKLLWEFSETDLGLTFGNPIISKMQDGTWVVMFSSGYNNVSSGDGNGHLYVLNANTGAKILKLDTNINGSPAGSSSTPSGLAKINNYVASDVDNTTQVVYGGDLRGNVWRFDINSFVKPYLSGMQVAQLKIGTTVQPITSKPALTEVTYNGLKYKVIYVGTGEYLGTTDLGNTNTQTIYALKDNWDTVGLGDVRSATNPAMVVQKASTGKSSAGGNIITGTANAVNWTTGIGWYLDLINSGERVNINPQIVLNALYVGTNIPNSDTCNAGGTSWLYKLDIATGSALTTSPDSALAVSLGNTLIVGLTNVQLTTKNVATIVTTAGGGVETEVGAQPQVINLTPRRTSWRVLN